MSQDQRNDSGPAIDSSPSSIGDDELEDTAEQTNYRLVSFDLTLLTNPTVIRAAAGIVVGLTVLVWPNRTDRILARLVGIALVWIAVASIQAAVKERPRGTLRIAVAIVGIATGLFLLLSPDRSAAFLGRLVGAAALVTAVRTAIDGRRSNNAGAGSQSWIAPMGALAAAGTLMLLFPEEMTAAATTTVAVGWIGISLLVVILSLDGRRTGPSSYQGATDLVVEWLAERPKSVDARQALYAKILFEGPNTQQRVIRFFALMGFAAVIASMGVLTDSTAVVIGAMLIAPLMTPLMGMAMSLVMGWPNRLARSAIVALGGIALAIGIGVLLGLVSPAIIDTATNTQIVARSSPTILDLITAIAAGAAGAYGLSRPDVSDSLPGVAIAISLVPPLSVVGIAYSQGDWASGNGALLLFATNMVAILIMGGLTFVMTGVTPIARVAENQHRMRTSLAAVLIAAIVVLGGLFLNGAQAAANLFQQSQVEETVDHWLSDSPLHRLVSAKIDDDTATVVILGPSEGLADINELDRDLTSALDRDISVDVRLIVEERLTSVED